MACLFYLRKRQSDRHFSRKRSLVRSDFSESRGFDKTKTNFSAASFLRLPGMTLINSEQARSDSDVRIVRNFRLVIATKMSTRDIENSRAVKYYCKIRSSFLFIRWNKLVKKSGMAIQKRALRLYRDASICIV